MIAKKLIVLGLVFLLAFSCSEKGPQLSQSKKPKTAAPTITELSNLPDSSKPVRIPLKKPVRRITAGRPVIHAFLDSTTHTVLPPEEQAAGFFTNYTSDDGLALDAVWCSVVDKDGNLWFGTDGGGVSRYDGRSFTNYTVEHGLGSNVVYTITSDRKGNLWFGTPSGVSQFDGRSFTNYATGDGLANVVIKIFEDRLGMIWVGTEGGGVSRYDGKRFDNLTTADGLAGNVVPAIAEDKSGKLWFGTQSGVSQFDGEHFTNYTTADGLAHANVYCILEDKLGELWFGTWGGGLSRFNGKKFDNQTTEQGLADNNVWAIAEDKSGKLWISTEHGISNYDRKTFLTFTTTNGLSANNVRSISEDKAGNLWFGTGGGGIIRYGGKSFMNYISGHGLGDRLIFGMIEDKAGALWFGKRKSGIIRYDGKSFSTYTESQGLAPNDAKPLVKDKKGNLWIATFGGGVSCFDGKSFTNYTQADGLSSNSISCITETRNGKIWFGTSDRGAIYYDGTGFINYSKVHGLPGNSIEYIVEDAEGDLWFGTRGGLARFDGSRFANYSPAFGLSHNFVYSAAMDSAGNLWFGTLGEGVMRFDGKSFMSFTVGEGLPDNNVSSIVIDSAGKIFFGTHAGLAVLVQFNRFPATEKEPLARPAQNDLTNDDLKNYTPHFEIYNVTSGYPIRDVNPKSMIQDSKGDLWIGTGAVKSGLIRFNSSSVNRAEAAPVLHSVKINNENLCWQDLLPQLLREDSARSRSVPHITEEATTFGFILTEQDRDSMRSKFKGIRFDSIRRFYPIPENLVLPYRHNNISFDFGSVELNSPNLVRYQYILEGYDKEWHPIADRTSVAFGNLHEGAYVFKLRAKSQFGNWSDPVIYTFKVLPPWHRTWWAYGLYILVFIISVWGFVKWRTRAIQKENKALEEKVANRTQALNHSLEELRSTQSQLIQSEKMASLGELTAGIAHEIQNPLNFVNNFSEVNNELIEELKIQKSKLKSEEQDEILNDIFLNNEKIKHHGKRADAIVKGMLQHSRASSGQKEPTDINALADEYLRLAYHGLRAKDKSFSATMKTDFDQSIDNINIIPQDIGRVVLNLINNAFYAVDEKKKQNSSGYEPTVSVSTKKLDGKVEIKVTDNGNGIPQKLLDKIFQPFFTTKPTGQGTGLGLSLAYDIMKAHGGEITVNTNVGEYTEFILRLPS